MCRYETTHHRILKMVRTIYLIMLWSKEPSTSSKTNEQMERYLQWRIAGWNFIYSYHMNRLIWKNLMNFSTKNSISFNQYKLFNVLEPRKMFRIRTHLFVQMIIRSGGYNHKNLQIHLTFSKLVIRSKFLKYAIRISPSAVILVILWHHEAYVIWKLTLFSKLVNGRMIFMKLSSNAPNVDAVQEERLIWMTSTLLNKMVQERFLMSKIPCFKTLLKQ